MSARSVRHAAGIPAIVAGALLLHGYHFGVSDQKLYVPAALRVLDPALYPFDADFFLGEARFTLYDEGLGALLGLGVPLDVVMFVGHVTAIALLLSAGLRLLERLTGDLRAAWAGVVLLALAMPIPVAGTRVGVMETYLHPRTLAIGIAAWAFVLAVERRWHAAPLLVLATAVHPLSGIWSAGHIALQAVPDLKGLGRRVVLLLGTLTLAACAGAGVQPVDEATYWRVAMTEDVFQLQYPLYWPWYEWLGVVAPIAMLATAAALARQRGASALATVTGRLALSAVVGVVVAVLLTVSPDRRLPFQPMRQLHLVYVVMILVLGARLEQRWVRGQRHRQAVVVGAGVGVALAVAPLRPASPHVEWPGRLPDNPYVHAFDWVRAHTPVDAKIAIDPFYLRRPGVDWHAARVFTRRSMLSDAVHDMGPAAMSPALSARWVEEQRALSGWPGFGVTEFARLARDFGVGWVILAGTQAPELDCPYADGGVRVCRTPGAAAAARSGPRQEEHRVQPAEREGIRDGGTDLDGARRVRDVVEVALGIRLLVVDRRRRQDASRPARRCPGAETTPMPVTATRLMATDRPAHPPAARPRRCRAGRRRRPARCGSGGRRGRESPP